jgi:hypothetical protein
VFCGGVLIQQFVGGWDVFALNLLVVLLLLPAGFMQAARDALGHIRQ